jgi:hypothetical protein
VGKPNRGCDLEGAGYGIFSYPPYNVFPVVADPISLPLDRATPLAAVVFMAADIGLHPPWVGLLDLKSVGRRRASALSWRSF